ncbi:hypothetical protein ONS95_012146 [Cadophora gregata]|uniref:uncharacterized protein n=1 Tax=Cadophora gregata TaxID=51156 RepID=UPI0026DC9E12|nr:uncharacterized protein ONS95_012146 [Cadophora gregata]KAK0117821.1 hypothetical protein ONS95_012146 [Cadophora gregata]KAK0122877.1 hypothetical protein ONS96_009903 [Cadophora gregata f. sp. sojae]
MGFDNLMMKLDETVTSVLGEWDIYSTALFAVVLSAFIYQVFTARDPDAHPMLLARQAQASPVRQEGESAVFRSHSSPHGIPLNSGLNVKDPGDSKWARGRDGDLRDVWRRAVAGGLDRDGKETGEVGKLLTVLGSEQVVEHDLSDITRQINLIGQNIKQAGGRNVAIYLPNSIEFLATLFACAFYDLNVTLVPYNQPIEKIISLLHKAKSDTVVAAVGSFPFDVITKSYPALEQLIWVVDDGSRHMDWNEVPKGTGGAVNVSTWSEIIQDQEPSTGSELPAIDKSSQPKKVLAFWPSGELTEFTHANIIAGIAGQLTSVPTTQRITHADLFLPVDSFATIYPLILTLSALYSNASVALNSVAGDSPDLVLATQGVAPTIIVASADTLAKTHAETAGKLNTSLYNIVHWFQTRALVQDGVMPLASMFSRMYDSLRPAIGTTPGKLRLIYVSEQAGVKSTPLSSQMLSDLRIYTGSRIIYALTSAKVAGAVTQTGMYDYRVGSDPEIQSHLGAPVTSIELFFRDTKQHKTTDTASAGDVFARGPAVVGGEAPLGISGKIREDYTLALL